MTETRNIGKYSQMNTIGFGGFLFKALEESGIYKHLAFTKTYSSNILLRQLY